MKRLPNRISVRKAALGRLLFASILVFGAARGHAAETYFKLDLSSPAIRSELEAQGAQIVEGPDGGLCLKIISSAIEGVPALKLSKTVSLPIDVEPLQDSKVAISARARGEDITKPVHNWGGIKVQLALSSAVGKKWIDESGVYGTFDWRPVTAMASIPADAHDGKLNLGMQQCSGTVWISDVAVRILHKAPVRPEPIPDSELKQQETQWRGVMSPGEFRERDFQDLRDWNVNLVRWRIGDKFMRNEDIYDERFAAEMQDLALALDAAQRYGIRLVVDVHFPPGARLPDGTYRMYVEPEYADKFVANWEWIARNFRDHPAVFAYDLVNEPVQNIPSPEGVDDWLELQVRTARAIREIDPDTPIMIETDEWNGVGPYTMMEPVDIPNIIYKVHMYKPASYTHQGVKTDQGVAKDKDSKEWTIEYPGVIEGQMVDKQWLREYLQPVRDFQKAYNAQIYVGEFSAVRWAPGAAQYIDDLISIFEEYGWDWTYHAFREWPGWSVEHADLPYDRHHHPKAEEPTDRENVLRQWFDLNLPAEELEQDTPAPSPPSQKSQSD